MIIFYVNYILYDCHLKAYCCEVLLQISHQFPASSLMTLLFPISNSLQPFSNVPSLEMLVTLTPCSLSFPHDQSVNKSLGSSCAVQVARTLFFSLPPSESSAPPVRTAASHCCPSDAQPTYHCWDVRSVLVYCNSPHRK